MKNCDIKIIDKNKGFVTQSYLKDDFAHIISCCDNRFSVRLCFYEMKVKGSYGKEDKYWKEFVKDLNINNLKQQLDDIFSPIAKNEEKLQLRMF